jgi:thiosulfate/3-mercaptopyruvate sulfurtransferase
MTRSTRSIDPLVSTEWLQAHLSDDGLAVIDIRFAEEYEAGHIPGAVSAPFGLVSAWADSGDLILELPPAEQLTQLARDCGLTAASKVVIVGRLEPPPGPPYPLADAVRAAATLIYMGIANVAVLDGAHAKWEREGRETTTTVLAVTPSSYDISPARGMFVTTDYVKTRIGKAVLVDGRDPEQYFGASIDPFADMRGHIPSARSLPVIWVWESDSTYRPPDLIEAMAEGVIGPDRNREVICYCGVGGYASTWWFLLTQLAGYTDVKIYDGSMEAWVEEKNPLVRYSWTE